MEFRNESDNLTLTKWCLPLPLIMEVQNVPLASQRELFVSSEMQEFTLLGTNLSVPQNTFEDDVPFPKVGIY